MSSPEIYEWYGGLCPNCKANQMIMKLRKSDGEGDGLFHCPCGHTRPQDGDDTIPAGWMD